MRILNIEGFNLRRTHDFKAIYKAVSIHPLPKGLTKNVWLSIPLSVEIPMDRDFILEGLKFEHPHHSMIGKRIQLLYDLSQSAVITDDYLNSYSLDEDQISIDEALQIEE